MRVGVGAHADRGGVALREDSASGEHLGGGFGLSGIRFRDAESEIGNVVSRFSRFPGRISANFPRDSKQWP